MMMNEEKVRIEKSRDDFYDAYYDVTDLIVNLPSYIKKVEVQFAEYIFKEELENGEVLKCFEEAFNNQPIVTNNRLKMDALTTTIYFADEHQIVVRNSEWGSILFK